MKLSFIKKCVWLGMLISVQVLDDDGEGVEDGSCQKRMKILRKLVI